MIGPMGVPPEEFDDAYRARERSPLVGTLVRDALGADLPPEVEPYSFVPLAGLREVAAGLRIARGERLVDLGCGRGGPGLWVARETGAALVGVDYSAVAVEHATARAPLFAVEARFAVADMAATGLETGCADAVMCIDAFQFGDPAASAREVARILRPGRRFVVSTWRPLRLGDEELPERVRDLDVPALLAAAGLELVAVEPRPRWLELQRRTRRRPRAQAAAA
jgi:SAM-dependent methyltransferase